MKLTDFVAQYLVLMGVKHAFVLQGGAALHLIDSVEKSNGIEAITMQHEQASAMAADGYARATKNLGCTMSTSGPGATNLLTGIACSYFDSVATVHITGNVASFRQSATLNVRQYGFQETDIVSMVKPICKYAVQLGQPEDILIELPKAIQIALTGRKGPVLIDIPDDFQREILNSEQVEDVLSKGKLFLEELTLNDITDAQGTALLDDLFSAQRPIMILGAGLICQRAKHQAVAFCQKYNIPYLTTWPLKGISNHDQPLNLGNFGTHSLRGNNIVLQNADFIFAIGSRLDSKATAKIDSFAREAEIAMVDIDGNEIHKFADLGLRIKHLLNVDTSTVFDQLSILMSKNSAEKKQDLTQWHCYIAKVRETFNFMPDYSFNGVNPYQAIKMLSEYLAKDANIVVDTGTCLPLTLVYGEEKAGQNYYSSYNNTPMGYALPAALGVALAKQSHSPTVLIAGDGGFQMNIQELATLSKLALPIIMIVFNNSGHAMIKQTQDDWLNSQYCSASPEYGMPEICFTKIAQAYGIASYAVNNDDELDHALSQAFSQCSPCLIELTIHQDFRYEPIIKYGNPLENMSPILDQKLINRSMLIPTYKN